MLPLDHLASQIRGRVIAPDDAGYDHARNVFRLNQNISPAGAATARGYSRAG